MKTIGVAILLCLVGPPARPQAPGARTAIAELFTIDSSQATVSFQVRYLRVPQVKGSFARVTGTVQFDTRTLEFNSLTLNIPSRNVVTPNHKQDNLLKGPVFLDSRRYPYIRFVSDTVLRRAGGYVARGTLTLRGVVHDFIVPLRLAPRSSGSDESIRLLADFRLRRPELARIVTRTAPGMTTLPGTDLTIRMDLPARREKGN